MDIAENLLVKTMLHAPLIDSTIVVGLPFGSPTVVVPGSRQGKPIEAHEVYRVAQVAG